MSISRRINEQIEKLDVDPEMKRMMMKILRSESQSKSNYKGLYDKVIEDYLKRKANEGAVNNGDPD